MRLYFNLIQSGALFGSRHFGLQSFIAVAFLTYFSYVANAQPPVPVYDHNFTRIRDDLAGQYQLRENIWLNHSQSGTDAWNPPDATFTGRLDFNGYRLLHWTYDNGNQPAVFLTTENAWLGNVVLDGFRVTGKPAAAMILGHNTIVDGFQIVRSSFKGWSAPRKSYLGGGDGAGIIIAGNHTTLNSVSMMIVASGGFGGGAHGGDSAGIAIEGDNASVSRAFIRVSGVAGLCGNAISGWGITGCDGGDSAGIAIRGNSASVSRALISASASHGAGGDGLNGGNGGDSVGIAIHGDNASVSQALISASGSGGWGGWGSFSSDLYFFNGGNGGNNAGIAIAGDSASVCHAFISSSGHGSSGGFGGVAYRGDDDAFNHTDHAGHSGKGGDSAGIFIKGGSASVCDTVISASGSGGWGGPGQTNADGGDGGDNAGVLIEQGSLSASHTLAYISGHGGRAGSTSGGADGISQLFKMTPENSTLEGNLTEANSPHTSFITHFVKQWLDWRTPPNARHQIPDPADLVQLTDSNRFPNCSRYNRHMQEPAALTGESDAVMRHLFHDGLHWHGFFANRQNGETTHHALYNAQGIQVLQARCNVGSAPLYLANQPVMVNALVYGDNSLFLAYHHPGDEGSQLARYVLLNGELFVTTYGKELPGRVLNLLHQDGTLYLVTEKQVYGGIDTDEPWPMLTHQKPADLHEVIKAADISDSTLFLLTEDTDHHGWLRSADNRFDPISVSEIATPMVLRVIDKLIHLVSAQHRQVRWRSFTLNGRPFGDQSFDVPEQARLANLMLETLTLSEEIDAQLSLIAMGNKGGNLWWQVLRTLSTTPSESGLTQQDSLPTWFKTVMAVGGGALVLTVTAAAAAGSCYLMKKKCPQRNPYANF